MKNQNVAQFRINERFTLSLSDLGDDHGGFEAMLIDFDSKSSDVRHVSDDGKFVQFIDIGDGFRVWDIDGLQSAIKDAKAKANKSVKEEVLQDNKELFIN